MKQEAKGTINDSTEMLRNAKCVNLNPMEVDIVKKNLISLGLGSIEIPISMKGRRVIHVNSTSEGGGVAEILQTLISYMCDIGLDAKWFVMQGDDRFYTITKRIHNVIHGYSGDGGCLSKSEHQHFDAISLQNFNQMSQFVNSGDIVVLHDPQTVGLIKNLVNIGIKVIWRCHIGSDFKDDKTGLAAGAWNFLQGYIEHANHFIFTREAFVPKWIDKSLVTIIAPSIDPTAPKNQEMSEGRYEAIVHHLGVVDGFRREAPNHNTSIMEADDMTFRKLDDSVGIVKHYGDIVHAGPLPKIEEPMILQISRWDHLKDMKGVMRAFAEYVYPVHPEAHLILAGPNVHGVLDDPEGSKAYAETLDGWRELPHEVRNRVQLICLPMIDLEENAAMVNALQRFATIIVQKSIFEGFGLTITEAMWKRKPVVASAVGGIMDQIEHGKHGLLIDVPTDLAECGKAINSLLDDTDFAAEIADNGYKRVEDHYLPIRHLRQFIKIFQNL